MSEAAAAVDKTLFAFLNGLAKRLYFKELEFSDEFLRNDVLGGISEEGEPAFNSMWPVFPWPFMSSRGPTLREILYTNF